MYTIPPDDAQLNNLIHNLTVLRQRHGLSQRRMAAVLHTTPYTLRLLEKGVISSHLYVDALFYACDHFQISIRELFNTRL